MMKIENYKNYITQERFQMISELSDNWIEGSTSYDIDFLNKVKNSFFNFFDMNLERPFIGPDADGNINFEWDNFWLTIYDNFEGELFDFSTDDDIPELMNLNINDESTWKLINNCIKFGSYKGFIRNYTIENILKNG